MFIEGTNITVENGNPAEMILVIAPTFRKFERWCLANDIYPRSHYVKYIREAADFRGIVNAWVKDMNTTADRAQDIYNTLDHYKATRGLKELP